MFNMRVLAANIRRARISNKITQSELADKVLVTTQAVSKWEKGLSCPDVSNLCMLSDVLKISVDELLGNAEAQKYGRTMIGIDGGGTKTEFILFSEYGDIIGHLMLEGSNPNSCGMDQTYRVLKNGIDKLLLRGSNVCGIFAGIAGINSGNNLETVQNFLKHTYPLMKIKCRSDIMNVIGCALNPEQCTVVISGTGSVVYAKEKEQLHRVGGWGYLLDTAGSGYDIGRDAICAALAQRDGIGAETLITELVENKLRGPVIKALNVIYEKDNQYIASYAPIVFEAGRRGDRIACSIIEKNAKRLSVLIGSAIEKYRVGNKVILSGSLLTKESIFVQIIQREKPELELLVPQFPQVFGACIQCCFMCLVNTDLFMDRFSAEYRRQILQKETDEVREDAENGDEK